MDLPIGTILPGHTVQLAPRLGMVQAVLHDSWWLENQVIKMKTLPGFVCPSDSINENLVIEVKF